MTKAQDPLHSFFVTVITLVITIIQDVPSWQIIITLMAGRAESGLVCLLLYAELSAQCLWLIIGTKQISLN